MIMPPYIAYLPVRPLDTPPPPEAYMGLLTDPVGQYGRAPYGAAMAFTLRGSEAFITRAHTLFDSFGGETLNGPRTGSTPRWTENRPVVLRSTPDPSVAFFCMPPLRVKTALRTYLYCQLLRRAGTYEVVRDEDGDPVDRIYTNDLEVEVEAAVLAETFYAHEIKLDYAALPEYQRATGEGHRVEHSVNDAEGDGMDE